MDVWILLKMGDIPASYVRKYQRVKFLGRLGNLFSTDYSGSGDRW